jgi:hypothetical protein
MPTTVNGWPYPASTAPPNVPADIQTLCLAIEAKLDRREQTTAAPVFSTGFAIGSVGSLLIRRGAMVTLNIGVIRTGATLTGPANSDLANAPILTIPVGWRPLANTFAAVLPAAGMGLMRGFIDDTGLVSIVALAATETWALNEDIRLMGTWLAAD